MSFASRLHYYRRILRAYATPAKSQLTFWHEQPEVNPAAKASELGEYYMPFLSKANYAGHHDSAGIPMLDYHGRIGLQYNPIAIAQWGLGNFNLLRRGGQGDHMQNLLKASDWLCDRLEQNRQGIWVWNHYFDWEYRDLLRSPWYSGLAQGQGISLLLRAYRETGIPKYMEAAERAFGSFLKSTKEGGVCFTDDRGNMWIEEYIVSPPTHILNGFIWALWGVYDYFLQTREAPAQRIFGAGVETLLHNLPRYDLGFWSLYEQSGTLLPMVASPFYHRLHIVQLKIMSMLTKHELFEQFAVRWQGFANNRVNRARALGYKAAFKLCYY
jgi:hypothetical protein